ncbi:MAG TPA: hypothetical protein VGO47_06905, partial [Chlamydiales bacterium]|nr:hypothetical protein [Chlamydiales bacterium]
MLYDLVIDVIHSHFTDEDKKDKLVRVVAPVGTEGVITEREGSGPTPVESNLALYASLLSPSQTISHVFGAPMQGQTLRYGYLHVIQTSGYNTKAAAGATVQVNGLNLSEGDGAFIESS